MQSKSLGSIIESLKYDYNIRGWLLGINRGYLSNTASNYFGMELGYDRTNAAVSYGAYTNPQFNGNISGTIWKTKGDNTARKYDFIYDNVNRLSIANFNQDNGTAFNKTAGIDFTVNNLQYDANGNILYMNQYGYKAGTSPLIDQLNYNYQTNSNKLSQVIDSQNDPQSNLGDFHYSSKQATDYTYDVNGNLIQVNNKSISNIGYNYLNLPQNIAVTSKGNIQYVYDASGNKLQKITVENTTNPATTTTTTYVGGFIYQNDVLQFISHEEGRARFIAADPVLGTASSFVFDYFIKDHLGNTRMVLTDEHKIDYYPVATLEPNAIATEKLYYAINDAALGNPTYLSGSYQNNNGNPPYNTNPTSSTSATSTRMYRLNAATGDKTGLGIALKVMAGDVIDIYGKSYFTSSNTGDNSNNNLSALSILTNLLSAPNSAMNVLSHEVLSGPQLVGIATNGTDVGNFLTNNRLPVTGNTPRAYINYIIFDDQFKYVTCGISQVGSNYNVKDHHLTDASMRGISVPKNGYLYVYCSNESTVDVFFDNLQVVNTKGPIIEETHYYPFGLTMAGISSKAAGKLENEYKYSSKELQHQEFNDGSGLEEYDYGARMYDNLIGRWMTIAPKAGASRRWTPYNYAYNNPIRYIDPDGMETIRSEDMPGTENGLHYGEVGHYLAGQAGHSSFTDWYKDGNGNYKYFQGSGEHKGNKNVGESVGLLSKDQYKNVQAGYLMNPDGYVSVNGGENSYSTVNTKGGHTIRPKQAVTEGDVTNSEPMGSESSPFSQSLEALDRGFTFNRVVDKLANLPLNETVEAAGKIVTGLGVAGSAVDAINSFSNKKYMDGTYSTFKVASTIAVFILCPEGMLLWGAELIVSDKIIKSTKN